MRITHIILIFMLSVCSAMAEPMYGFKGEDIITKGYKFKFLSSKPDKNHGAMGTFSFRWNGKKPIKIHGFGFEKNGDFRVRFEQVSRFSDGKWLVLPILSCGTGAQLFSLQPGKNYKILVPMWRFAKDLEYKIDPPQSGDKGAVQIVGDGISLVSDPFALPSIPQK